MFKKLIGLALILNAIVFILVFYHSVVSAYSAPSLYI
jgi:hypothetical protein